MSPIRNACMMGALIAPLASLANPVGPTVAQGAARFATSGSTLTVTNSPNAIIHWRSFSIGAGETTRFDQQSAASAVLNRVTTQSPSAILGALQSNGRVFLVNPNGIVFGPQSQVDVAGLVASTLDISNADFLAGRLRFAGAGGAAVVNRGEIETTGARAPVYLIGPAVTNGGVITSPRGEVILAAGRSVEVVDPGTPNLRVEIRANGNQTLNLGSVLSAGGRIDIVGGVIRQNGRVSADSAAVTPDGRIVLAATGRGTVSFGADSLTSNRSTESAEVPPGGPLSISGTNVHVAGIVSSGPQTIDARGTLSLAFTPTGAAAGDSRAFLTAVGGQVIRARDLRITAIDGPALIENYGGIQRVQVSRDITIRSGAEMAGLYNVFGDRQLVSARHVVITNTGGSTLGGSYFVPGIGAGGAMTLNARGDIRLTATGGESMQGARIGDLEAFPATPGEIRVRAGGHLVLNGQGAAIAATEPGAISVTTGGRTVLDGGASLRTPAAIAIATRRADVRGRISSGSRIGLRLPDQPRPGWSVNGAPGAVTRGDYGFFVADGPAVLGQTLLVTYE